MRTNAPRLLIAVLGLSVGADGWPGEIYRWVDDAGATHYGDRPGTASARLLDIDTVPEPTAAAPSDGDRMRKTQRLLDAWAEERSRRQSQREREKAEQAELALKCEKARKYQKDINRAGLLYRENDAGERTYLSDEERDQQLERAREMVGHYCN